MNTLAELQAKHPSVYELAIAAGKAQGIAEAKPANEAAIQSANEAAVVAATKPLTDKIATLEADVTTMRGAFEGLKPVLAKIGVVNEKITDVEAATRLAQAEGKLAAAQGELATIKTANEALVKDRDAETAKVARAGIAVKVREQYKAHRFVDDIVAACEGAPTLEKALELATQKVADIQKYMGKPANEGSPNGYLPPSGEGGGDNDKAHTERRAVAGAIWGS